MPFEIVRNDITHMKVDAVVNAANAELQEGGGVCGAIFAAAGRLQLQEACDQIDHAETGSAVITPGFQLPAKYIIHTVGPIWQGGGAHERALLWSCYTESLKLAQANHCASIAFPLISAGIYGYPRDEALSVALGAISAFLAKNEMQVYLTIFDNDAFHLSGTLFPKIRQFVDASYVEAHTDRNRKLPPSERQAAEEQNLSSFSIEGEEKPRKKTVWDLFEKAGQREAPDEAPCQSAMPSAAYSAIPSAAYSDGLKDILGKMDETFSEYLIKLVDQRGLKDSEVYRRANIDRRLFSKIRCDKHYKPTKKTAVALAIGLNLNLDETQSLLAKAGYTLSDSSESDVIVKFFLMNEKEYDINTINMALFDYHQELLGV